MGTEHPMFGGCFGDIPGTRCRLLPHCAQPLLQTDVNREKTKMRFFNKIISIRHCINYDIFLPFRLQ